MLFALLSGDSAPAQPQNPWAQYVLLIGFVVIMVVLLVVSNRRNKKRQKEEQDLRDAVKPGNKVKTIGGICGIVVEVDSDENTFVLETGSEASGKCYIKFDKQAIYQTDAVAETKASEKAEEAPVEESPVEETSEENK